MDFEKVTLVEPRHPFLSISTQCDLLQLSRSSFYAYQNGQLEKEGSLIVNDPDEKFMSMIDRIYTEFPFY